MISTPHQVASDPYPVAGESCGIPGAVTSLSLPRETGSSPAEVIGGKWLVVLRDLLFVKVSQMLRSVPSGWSKAEEELNKTYLGAVYSHTGGGNLLAQLLHGCS